MTRAWTTTAAAVVSVAAIALGVPASASAALRAGAGRADVTPPPGQYLWGWFRADAVGRGVQTRLFARAIVLQQGGRKVALVTADLGAMPGGLVQDVARRVAARGFSEQNVLISATHTHSGPGGLFSFDYFETVAPPPDRLSDGPRSAADPRIYGFMVRQLAAAIIRADKDLGPAAAGWASTDLLRVTRNRSLEAHLADHGLSLARGKGKVGDDPAGYRHTITPDVDVLRIDRIGHGGRRTPLGTWSSFANHGTVVKATFTYYNGDHHAAAERVVEAALRRGAVRGREVVNVFANGAEGDVSAGLGRGGPAAAEETGEREARAMLAAWRSAGRVLGRDTAIDLRWTRVCLCGQQTLGGKLAATPVNGLPQVTGSEEGRGPAFETSGQQFEGRTSPVDDPEQGHKIVTTSQAGQVPQAAPLLALRLGDRLLASIPGEMTTEMGRRLRASLGAALRGAGIRKVLVAGLANEYIYYWTTPEEYQAQHYEGGSTLYGPHAGDFLLASQVELGGRLARGEPAPPPYPYDPTAGKHGVDEPYGRGAARGTVVAQPKPVARLQRATFTWAGARRGLDRPLDSAFVVVQRRAAGRWVTAHDDLGLTMLWSVDGGRYRARWEVPLDEPAVSHRFVVRANRYRLASAPFRVTPSRSLVVRRRGAAVTLDYPVARENVDLTARPAHARGGEITFRVGGAERRVVQRRGERFPVPAGGRPVVGAGAARDRFGNTNGAALRG
jgi:neutral ceramidase